MNSCSRVGDIFIEAGKRYNKLGDDIMLLHPSAQELAILEAKQVLDTLQTFFYQVFIKLILKIGSLFPR